MLGRREPDGGSWKPGAGSGKESWKLNSLLLLPWNGDLIDLIPSELTRRPVQRVKQRMIEIEPRGFKYIVTATLSENLGQAGR